MSVAPSMKLAVNAAEANVARIGPHLQHRSAAIQLTFRRDSFFPRSAFTRNVNTRKITVDRVAIGDFDLGSYRDRQILRMVNGNVARRSFESGCVMHTS